MDEGLAPVPDGHQGHPERVSSSSKLRVLRRFRHEKAFDD